MPQYQLICPCVADLNETILADRPMDCMLTLL